MNVTPFIPNKDPELPDFYSIKVEYLNGDKEEIEVVEHITKDTIRIHCADGDFTDQNGFKFRIEPSPIPYIEYVTKDDTWGYFPVTSIKTLKFDKRFSKIVELKKNKSAELHKTEP